MALAIALVAALLFALGSVLQQKAGMDDPESSEGTGSGLLLRMARKPVWIAGIVTDALGFAGQAIALTIGRLAVVQPVLAFSMVFALPLGNRLTGQRVTRNDVGAALLVSFSLVAFLVFANPTGGRDDAPFGQWLIAGAVCAVVCVPLVLVGMRSRPAIKAALLGSAVGVLFGLSAALTKAVGDQFTDGPLEIFLHWQIYALAALGYISMTFNQMALTTGVLAPALATSMAIDPIASVVLGTTLLQESLHQSAAGITATVLALAAAIAGMVILARTSQGATASKPGSGTALGRVEAGEPEPAAAPA